MDANTIENGPSEISRELDVLIKWLNSVCDFPHGILSSRERNVNELIHNLSSILCLIDEEIFYQPSNKIDVNMITHLLDQLLRYSNTMGIIMWESNMPNEHLILELHEESWTELLRVVLYVCINSDKRDDMVEHIRILTIIDQTQIMEIINEMSIRYPISAMASDQQPVEERYHELCQKYQIMLEENDRLRIDVDIYRNEMEQVERDKESCSNYIFKKWGLVSPW